MLIFFRQVCIHFLTSKANILLLQFFVTFTFLYYKFRHTHKSQRIVDSLRWWKENAASYKSEYDNTPKTFFLKLKYVIV